MSEGSNVTKAQREADLRIFLPNEAKTIEKNAPKRPTPAPAPKKDTPKRSADCEIRYAGGRTLTPPVELATGPEDKTWTALVTYTGPTAGLEVGYVNCDNEF